jgi:hypothetical protein
MDENTVTYVFLKDGDGRLYYRVGLQYALDTNTFEPKESGFEVIRTYESVDNKKHVKFNVKKNRWTFAAGSTHKPWLRERNAYLLFPPHRRKSVGQVIDNSDRDSFPCCRCGSPSGLLGANQPRYYYRSI